MLHKLLYALPLYFGLLHFRNLILITGTTVESIHAAQSWVAWQSSINFFFSYYHGRWFQHFADAVTPFITGIRKPSCTWVGLGPLCVLYCYYTSQHGHFIFSILISSIKLPMGTSVNKLGMRKRQHAYGTSQEWWHAITYTKEGNVVQITNHHGIIGTLQSRLLSFSSTLSTWHFTRFPRMTNIGNLVGDWIQIWRIIDKLSGPGNMYSAIRWVPSHCTRLGDPYIIESLTHSRTWYHLVSIDKLIKGNWIRHKANRMKNNV